MPRKAPSSKGKPTKPQARHLEPQSRPLKELHPSATIEPHPIQLLKGKRIALGMTGSIASVKGVELARELARHGAEVVCLMSEASAKIVGTQSMEFATGRPVITEIGGQVEHVTLARSGGCQGYLIAPCTATTMGRIAQGIGDTPVALAALSLLGTSTPILLAPAMDGSMEANPAVRENMDRVQALGCTMIPPVGEEGKAKLAEVDSIAAQVCRHCGPRDWEGRKVLIVAGSSSEPLDGVRVLTNRSSGRTGIELARALYNRGAEVELWYGESPFPIPEYLGAKKFTSIGQVMDMVGKAKQARTRWDWTFVPAALADYIIEEPFEFKLSSTGSPPDLELAPAPRALEVLRPLTNHLVGFKLEVGITQDELVRRAQTRLQPQGPCDMVVANLADEALGGTDSKAILVGGPKGQVQAELKGPKMAVAHGLLQALQD